MKHLVLILFLGTLITSCAKIPIQSVDLIDAIQKEGERMHQINISLVNSVFEKKKEQVDNFVQNNYAPNFANEVINRISSDSIVKSDLIEFLSYSLPIINGQREKMYNSLEDAKNVLINDLHKDHIAFQNACEELKKLLISAVKVDEEREKLLRITSTFSNNKIDPNTLESAIDSYLSNNGDSVKTIEGIQNIINK